MLDRPYRIIEGAAAWETVFAAPHKFDYLFEVAGVDYVIGDIQPSPAIERTLMREPRMGGCGSSTLSLTVRPKGTIPKGAAIKALCRMIARDEKTYTSWYELGTFKVSTRSACGELLELKCRDSMALAGQTYTDKTQYIEWPVRMDLVISEIAQIMGLEIDNRTVINPSYMVDYPNEDYLMSEVLSMCAAAHGGVFIVTPQNKLRLVIYPDARNAVSMQALDGTYTRYIPYSTGVKAVSRITLNDIAGNQFTSGSDGGIELAGNCDYATQNIANAVYSALNGAEYRPFALSGAYLNPLLELGDAFTISRKGEELKLIIGTMKMKCNSSCASSVEFGVQEDDEEEYPYVSAADRQANRYITTTKAYFGNRINRKEGFVSEYVKDDKVVARFTANANLFAMQQKVDNVWQDRIYFDPVAGKYKITGDVEIEGQVTVSDLATRGKTTIHGDNITTGTLNTNQVKIAGSENFMWNEDYIVAKNPSNPNQQIRYGKYDGSNMGVAFTTDGGNTWQSAIGFNGVVLGTGSVTKSMLASDIDFTKIHDGTAAPANPVEGTLWLDNTTTPASLKRYNASTKAWVAVTDTSVYDQRIQKVELAVESDRIVSTVMSATSYVDASGQTQSVGEKICSQIEQTKDTVQISASKIRFNGHVITNASLTTGNWTFDSNGSSYTNGGISVSMSVMSGDFVGGGSSTRAFYTSSNCDVQYGSDYGYSALIRAGTVKIIAQNSTNMWDYKTGIFSKHPDWDDKGYSDFTFYCDESSKDTPKGNLGHSYQPWDTIYVNKCFRLSEQTFSSRFVKHDIEELPDMGDLLDQLVPVSFKYNYKHVENQTRYGLILEDAVKVLPTICTVPECEEGSEEYTSEATISYTDLIAPMLKEIQLLRARVKKLEGFVV